MRRPEKLCTNDYLAFFFQIIYSVQFSVYGAPAVHAQGRSVPSLSLHLVHTHLPTSLTVRYPSCLRSSLLVTYTVLYALYAYPYGTARGYFYRSIYTIFTTHP